jgi:nucleoside-diphosphate-sugar epimerase
MRFDLTVNEFAMTMLVHKRLVVFGEQFWRPYLHVRDAARAIGLVLEAPAGVVRGEVFNAGDTAENYRKLDLVGLLEARLSDGQVEYVPRDEDPRDYRVSFERIRQRLNFKISRTVGDGMDEVISAIRQGVIADWDHPGYRN